MWLHWCSTVSAAYTMQHSEQHSAINSSWAWLPFSFYLPTSREIVQTTQGQLFQVFQRRNVADYVVLSQSGGFEKNGPYGEIEEEI